jgi:hypothetical protein
MLKRENVSAAVDRLAINRQEDVTGTHARPIRCRG